MLSARSALLSNYEVLTLLKELESEQLARQKTAIRIKKEEEEKFAAGLHATVAPNESSLPNTLVQEEVRENLRTVEFEVRVLNVIPGPASRAKFTDIHRSVRPRVPHVP